MSTGTTSSKRCSVCRKRRDDVEGGGVCESCCESYVRCGVCREWIAKDGELCRHIFDANCTGYYEGSGYWFGGDELREPFFALLDKLKASPPYFNEEPPVIEALADAIKRNSFFAKWEGWMFSTPDIVLYRWCVRRPASESWARCFARIRGSDQEAWFGDLDRDHPDFEALEDGLGWLFSLQCGKTKLANAQTAKWIEEWRAAAKGVRLGAFGR